MKFSFKIQKVKSNICHKNSREKKCPKIVVICLVHSITASYSKAKKNYTLHLSLQGHIFKLGRMNKSPLKLIGKFFVPSEHVLYPPYISLISLF